MKDLGDELETAAAHVHEVRFQQTEAGMQPVAESTRMPNPYASQIKAALEALAPLVQPIDGYKVRVLVSGSDDTKKTPEGKPAPDGNAHVRIELDLVRS